MGDGQSRVINAWSENKNIPIFELNEAGKTVFLQALQKASGVVEDAEFDYVHDYPRNDLNLYEPKHAKTPADVVVLRYRLNEDETKQLNTSIGSGVKTPL